MKVNKRDGKLAILTAIFGLSYLPMANADQYPGQNLGALSIPATISFSDQNISAGSFTDTFTFTVDQSATAGSVASGTGASTGYSLDGGITVVDGLQLTSINLYGPGNVNLTTGQDSIALTMVGSPDPVLGEQEYTFSGGFSGVSVATGTTYSLKIGGYSSGVTETFYSGTLGLAGNNASATPEPEQWAMMLLGMPLIAWAVRRKQGGHANSNDMQPSFS